MCPAQPDALKSLFLAVQAAGYTVHAEFVPCHTNGTARRGARAFCVACRRRMCYADDMNKAFEPKSTCFDKRCFFILV